MRIRPTQLGQFLQRRGWRPADFDSRPMPLLAFDHPNFPLRQLAFPETELAPDYDDAVSVLLEKLASLEGVSIETLRREAEKLWDGGISESVDSYSIRILQTGNDDDGIPLSMARTCLQESEVLLMSASCQAETPAPYYRRIDNRISNALIDRTIFNHTRRGSFVLTVSCGIAASGEQLNLDLNSVGGTKSRRAFTSLYRGVVELSSVIHDGRAEEFARDTAISVAPIVSANLCEALGNLVSSSPADGLSIGFSWSPLLPLPKDFHDLMEVSYQREMASTLYQISTALLPEEETRTDTFIGTVEALRGDLDASGGRAGWVEFLLFNIVDNRPIRASAYLDATQYKVADEAHIAGAQEVAITGTLEPRPRVWYLRDIKGLRLAT